MYFKEGTVWTVILKPFEEQLLLVGVSVVLVSLHFYHYELSIDSEHEIWFILDAYHLILIKSPDIPMCLPVLIWSIVKGREQL